MARDSNGGIVKLGLLAAAGYFVYRWWAEREPAPGGEETSAPNGVVSELEALLDSLRRTAAGGIQPGDTDSLKPPDEEVVNGNGGEAPVLTLREKLLLASKGDTYFTADHKADVHRWNYYFRQVTGLSDPETPDMAAIGDPADLLSVEGYLARRTAVGLSGLGLGQLRRPLLRRARYPVWLPRPGGRSACGCASTGCNCYRV